MNRRERKELRKEAAKNARWERKKAKEFENSEIMRRIRENKEAHWRAEEFAKTYKPPMDTFLRDVRLVELSPSHLLPYGWHWHIKYRDDTMPRMIDLEATIESLKEWAYFMELVNQGHSFGRQTKRVGILKDELLGAAHKFRAVRACHAVKEELMAAVWHPRRVEHILETYGWEAYENLLGEE